MQKHHPMDRPADTITVRKMRFEFSESMELCFIDRDPKFSFVFLGTWLILPYLEPYLMRTIRSAMNQVEDEQLRHDMKQFCSQEGQHFKQHAAANTTLLSHVPGPIRQKIERRLSEVEAEYRAFSEEKPLAWNLAYAEGFEAYTSAGGRAQLEQRIFDHMSDPIRDLMLWHIMEEMEHRTVAFDAYEALVGKYFFRLRVGLWAQSHFIRIGAELGKLLEEAFPDIVAKGESADAKAVAGPRRRRLLKETLFNVLGTYSPWYTPRRATMPVMYEQARAEYDGRAVSLSH